MNNDTAAVTLGHINLPSKRLQKPRVVNSLQIHCIRQYSFTIFRTLAGIIFASIESNGHCSTIWTGFNYVLNSKNYYPDNVTNI